MVSCVLIERLKSLERYNLPTKLYKLLNDRVAHCDLCSRTITWRIIYLIIHTIRKAAIGGASNLLSN